ncbi:hypothetical protein B0F90DRAFT_300395 [Multifurca ochricompacta]|uniref:Uncharacterized protein n=1 Tax=Multifurca ochricompacta TaxID=376703 RepID=A0AAD4LVT7_9AGAM|nr:hypothetical protein B0F90DRAFT_300395 [Multifurca ochricompacta]
MSNSESTPAVTSDIPKPIDTDEGDTTDPSIDDILKAIKEIELPPLSPDEPGEDEPPPQFPDNFDKGFTNCGSLQSLSREIPAQSKEDALHWTLFGQLAADADCINRGTTRQNDPSGWYNFYFRTLGQIGMSVCSQRVQCDRSFYLLICFIVQGLKNSPITRVTCQCNSRFGELCCKIPSR